MCLLDGMVIHPCNKAIETGKFCKKLNDLLRMEDFYIIRYQNGEIIIKVKDNLGNYAEVIVYKKEKTAWSCVYELKEVGKFYIFFS